MAPEPVRAFGRCESGAITLDWTVLAALVLGFSVGVVGIVASGAGKYGERLGASLTAASPDGTGLQQGDAPAGEAPQPERPLPAEPEKPQPDDTAKPPQANDGGRPAVPPGLEGRPEQPPGLEVRPVVPPGLVDRQLPPAAPF